MDFIVTIENKPYHCSEIGCETFLVNDLWILYKKKGWVCADDLSKDLVEDLGAAIEKHASSVA